MIFNNYNAALNYARQNRGSITREKLSNNWEVSLSAGTSPRKHGEAEIPNEYGEFSPVIPKSELESQSDPSYGLHERIQQEITDDNGIDKWILYGGGYQLVEE